MRKRGRVHQQGELDDVFASTGCGLTLEVSDKVACLFVWCSVYIEHREWITIAE